MVAAFLLLSRSVTVPLAIFAAAVCHEAAHCAALTALHAPPTVLTLSGGGAALYVPLLSRLSYGGELFCTAAGPLCNLALWATLSLTGIEALAVFSGANLILGALNLLPVRSLDGGRLLWLLAALVWEPYRADRIADVVGAVTACSLLGGCLYLTVTTGGGLFLLPGALWLAVQSVKKPLPNGGKAGKMETYYKS